jgi:hypothetical protein
VLYLLGVGLLGVAFVAALRDTSPGL